MIALGVASCGCTKVPKLTQEAVDALKALRSVSGADINYQNYAPRVLDAKVKVDRYLESPNASGPLRMSINAAMKEYLLASAAWNASIASDLERTIANGDALTKDADISKCPAVAGFVEAAMAERSELILTTPMSKLELSRCIDNPQCFAAMKEEAARRTEQIGRIMALCKIGEKLGIIRSGYDAKKPDVDRMTALAKVGGKDAVRPLWTCASEHTAEADRLLH